MQRGIDDLHVGAVDADARSRAATELQMKIAIAAIAILAGVLAFLIGRSVSRPLSAMTRAMRELAEGNFDVMLLLSAIRSRRSRSMIEPASAVACPQGVQPGDLSRWLFTS
jgi:methyl-accepting chemotaxis protein